MKRATPGFYKTVGRRCFQTLNAPCFFAGAARKGISAVLLLFEKTLFGMNESKGNTMKAGAFPFLAALIIYLSFFISCCSTKSTPSHVETQAAISPFEITYSETGGLTGMRQSYLLQSTGKAAVHQQLPGKKDSVIWAGTFKADEIARLQKELEACGLSDMKLSGRGNVTSSLVYATADTSYEYSWAGAGAMADIPDSLKSWISHYKLFFNLK